MSNSQAPFCEDGGLSEFIKNSQWLDENDRKAIEMRR